MNGPAVDIIKGQIMPTGAQLKNAQISTKTKNKEKVKEEILSDFLFIYLFILVIIFFFFTFLPLCTSRHDLPLYVVQGRPVHGAGRGFISLGS